MSNDEQGMMNDEGTVPFDIQHSLFDILRFYAPTLVRSYPLTFLLAAYANLKRVRVHHLGVQGAFQVCFSAPGGVDAFPHPVRAFNGSAGPRIAARTWLPIGGNQ